MNVIPLKQTPVIAGSTTYYLPMVFSGGQQYTYSFTVDLPEYQLPDNLVTIDMLKSYVANNYQIPNTALAVVSLWYDYSTLNTVAMIGDLTDFQMMRLLTQNSNGVYVTDKTHGVMEIPSNGTQRQVCMKFSFPISSKGFIKVNFPQALSAIYNSEYNFTVGGQISGDNQVCVVNMVQNDPEHPMTTSSCWVYVAVIGGGPLPGNAQLYCDITGVP